MFINTAKTTISNSNEQKVYDSRNQKHKNESFALDAFEARKLENIIEMYKRNKPVLCSISTSEGEVVGIPFEKGSSFIKVQLSEDQIREIQIKNIKGISIIKF